MTTQLPPFAAPGYWSHHEAGLIREYGDACAVAARKQVIRDLLSLMQAGHSLKEALQKIEAMYGGATISHAGAKDAIRG